MIKMSTEYKLITKKFIGKKYMFEIVSEGEKDDVLFFIRAVHKTSKRTSCINNLNVVLSEFGIEEVSNKFGYSSWIVTKKEALFFTKTAKSFLSSLSFRNYLEMRLDEDRECGEWENFCR